MSHSWGIIPLLRQLTRQSNVAMDNLFFVWERMLIANCIIAKEKFTSSPSLKGNKMLGY